MNSQAFNDPRVDALAAELRDVGVERTGAVGLLELMLHFVAEFTPDGDLSRFAAASVARALGWSGAPDRLLAAFRNAGYVTAAGRFDDWGELVEWRDDA